MQPDPIRDAATFGDFYPLYLAEHRDRSCRRLHFLGSSLGLVCLGLLMMRAEWWWLPIGLLCGYACAWVGHFVFEKNRPATFKYPFYSFAGDWVMFKDILTGKIRF